MHSYSDSVESTEANCWFNTDFRDFKQLRRFIEIANRSKSLLVVSASSDTAICSPLSHRLPNYY